MASRRSHSWWNPVVVILALPVLLYCVPNVLSTGYPFPLFHIESLRDPVPIKNWTAKGLVLADGRLVMPAGMRSLPTHSRALQEVTRRGIEIARNGRVFGLMKIWHWCGNDALRYDIRRIDVTQLLRYLRQGDPIHKLHSRLKPYTAEGAFSPSGWSSSDYTAMKMADDPKFKTYFDVK